MKVVIFELELLLAPPPPRFLRWRLELLQLPEWLVLPILLLLPLAFGRSKSTVLF